MRRKEKGYGIQYPKVLSSWRKGIVRSPYGCMQEIVRLRWPDVPKIRDAFHAFQFPTRSWLENPWFQPSVQGFAWNNPSHCLSRRPGPECRASVKTGAMCASMFLHTYRTPNTPFFIQFSTFLLLLVFKKLVFKPFTACK